MKTASKKGITTKQTTYDRLMKSAEFREKMAEAEVRLAISELLVTLMEMEQVSVRELAKRSEVAASIIQDLRSGKRENPTLSNFSKLVHSMGFDITITKGRKVLAHV